MQRDPGGNRGGDFRVALARPGKARTRRIDALAVISASSPAEAMSNPSTSPASSASSGPNGLALTA
jgi:hypothetical protein